MKQRVTLAGVLRLVWPRLVWLLLAWWPQVVFGGQVPIEIAAAGDLQLGKKTSAAQLAPLKALLVGQVRFANLEGPLTDRGRGMESLLAGVGDGTTAGVGPGPDGLRFAAPPAQAAWLSGLLDVVSLANNHALDQGEAGRTDTAQALSRQGIAFAWRGHDGDVSRQGRRVLLLARDLSEAQAYSQGGPVGPEQAELTAAVREARARGAVLVSLHWGKTGSLLPSSQQRLLARSLIDAGAAAVLGHGPHTIQGIELHGRGVIAYSLGNLAFSCACTEVSDAYVLRFLLDFDNGVSQVRAVPFSAGLLGQPPQPASPKEDAGLFELLETLTADLGQKTERRGGVIWVR